MGETVEPESRRGQRTPQEQADVPGLDLDRFTQWCARNHPAIGTPRQARLLTGGHSNITIAFESDLGTLVLRRPPLGHVMETAHDMLREARVVGALADTDVPLSLIHI